MYPFVHFGTLSLYTFGICVGAGILCSCYAFAAYCDHAGLKISTPRLFGVMIPAGLLSAHLDAMLLDAPRLVQDPVGLFLSSGYTYLGGMLGALVACAAVIVLSGWPLLHMLDGLFCAAPGYAIGRVGCFLAGDGDYGPATMLPWGISFPHGIVPTEARVHPTMLYIALWELIVFAIFGRVYARSRLPITKPGRLLAMYLVGSGVGRCFLESLSLNPKVWLGYTEAQWVSAGLVVFGLLLFWRSARSMDVMSKAEVGITPCVRCQ